MEFVNGKDDIPYMKWKRTNVWNHQPVYVLYKSETNIFASNRKNTTWYTTCLSGRCHLTCVSQVTPYVPFSNRFTHTKTLRNRSLPVAGPITTLAAHHGSCSPMAGKSEILNVVHPGLRSAGRFSPGWIPHLKGSLTSRRQQVPQNQDLKLSESP